MPFSHDNTTSMDVVEKAKLLPIPNRTIMLIHVGKTGGSTFTRTFYERYWKDGNVLQRTPVLVPVCHMQHCRADKVDSATSLLFIVRNPVERLISAYKFSHPDNCVTFDPRRGRDVFNDIWGCRLPAPARRFYRDCAASLEDLANVPFAEAGARAGAATDGSCRRAVRDMVGGRDRAASTHAFFNYAHYKNATLDRRDRRAARGRKGFARQEVLVLRTERLWEDAAALDRLLGGTGAFDTAQKVTHGSEHYRDHTSALSPRGYERLCCLLGEEMDAFEVIVRRAANLNASEKEATVRDVEDRCGISSYRSRRAWADSCRNALDKANSG